MGWLSAIGSIFSWLGGEGLAQALVRIAIGFGLTKLLANKETNPAESTTSSTVKGTRQQISPATDNKLPVAYGDSYFSGTIVDVQLVNGNKELYSVIALCEMTGDIWTTNKANASARTASTITIDDIYMSNSKIVFTADGKTVSHLIDDTGVIDTNPANLVSISLYQGNSNNPMLPCQPGTTTPITGTVPPVAYEVMPGWNNTYLMSNIVFAIVKMNYDPSKGIRSIPQLKFHVRNSITKPVDVLHDYATNQMYGAGLTDAQIDYTTFDTLDTYSEEMITLGTYPAQSRYRINGLVRTTENVLQNLEKVAASAGSAFSFDISTGKWGVIVNKLTSKTLDFDDSNIIGPLNAQGSNLDSYYNQIEVQFPYKILRDQFNFVRVNLPEALLNENETPNMYQLTHEFTNDVVQATVLANLDLRQAREDLIVAFNTDYSKYNIQIGDVVGITNEVYNWTSKLFRVIRIKRNESDTGQLTLEITCQAYNADVYTVEDITDFVPLIGAGYSVPSLSAIASPIAPTATVQSLSSQPSITITGTVPVGVVTLMEFWYTTDASPDYTLLGTKRSENGGPFTVGDTVQFRTIELQTGNYYFKVRAVNATGSSAFSPASNSITWTYVQAPDVLPYTAPIVDSTGNPVEEGSDMMTMGLMAAYLASKLDWGNVGNNLSSIFGISSNAAGIVSNVILMDEQALLDLANIETDVNSLQSQMGNVDANTAAIATQVATSVATDVATQATANVAAEISANVSIMVDVAIADYDKWVVAGKFVVHDPDEETDGHYKIRTVGTTDFTKIGAVSNTVGTDFFATGPGTGTGTAWKLYYNTSTLNGKVFPMIFGSGATAGSVDSRAGIFTHDYLVFGGNAVASAIKSTNIITNDQAKLKANVAGLVHNFYNFPSLTTGSWSQKPVYNETLTNKNDVKTELTLYYATATYGGGNLDQQSWSNWNRVSSTGDIPITSETIYTNPEPTITVSTAPYIVEDSSVCAAGPGWITDFGSFTDDYTAYDPFKPNVAVTITTTPTTAELPEKENFVHTEYEKAFAGAGTQLIIFGASVYNLPDGTPFNNNTVFGHVSSNYIYIHRDAISLRSIVNNGARFVGINAENDFVYWSDDGKFWSRVEKLADVTHDNRWLTEDYLTDPQKAEDTLLAQFKFLVYDGSKFLAYSAKCDDLDGPYYRCATSTDGKLWTEYTLLDYGLDPYTTQVIAKDGHYLSVGLSGVQVSLNGISWSSTFVTSEFGTRGPTCGVWDGTKFIVGARWDPQVGAVLLTSVDGSNWTKMDNVSNPRNAMKITQNENTLIDNELSYQGLVKESDLSSL